MYVFVCFISSNTVWESHRERRTGIQVSDRQSMKIPPARLESTTDYFYTQIPRRWFKGESSYSHLSLAQTLCLD